MYNDWVLASVGKRWLRFGPFELDADSGELYKHGVRLQLQPKPQQLLLLLIERPGAVITREEVRRRLWGDGTFVDFESGLNTTANRLRLKLGDSAEQPRYIETLPRIGYRFIAPVESLEPETAAPPPAPSRSRWRWLHTAIAAAILTVAALAYFAARHPVVEPGVRFRELTFRRGQVLSARFTPGGESILYTAQWEGAPRELYLTTGSGPESRPLGLSDLSLASVSRSGELAMLSFGGTMNIGGGALFRVPMNSAARTYVDRGITTAEWLGDGALAVVRAIDGSTQLEYPIGKAVFRTAGWLSNIRASSISGQIAFVEHPVRHDEGGRLLLFEPGRGVRPLGGSWVSIAGLAFHPNGEIWFTAARESGPRCLWAITRRGRLRLVAQAPGTLTLRDIAPDGRALVTRDARRLEMAGRIADDAGERDFSWLDWSRVQEVGPDARLILFDESGEATGPHTAAYIHNTREKTTTRLGEGRAMGLSPDGEWALLATDDLLHLMLVPIKGGAAKRLPDTGLHYQWARFFPDGRRLLASASREQEGLRLYVQALDSASFTAISPGVMIRNAAISPDGQWVAALSDKNGLVLYPASAGSAPKSVPSTEPLAPLRWTADGTGLFVQHLRRASDASALVSRIDMRSGRLAAWRTLQPSDKMGVNSITGVALAPDGPSYVYSYRRVLSELFLAEGL